MANKWHDLILSSLQTEKTFGGFFPLLFKMKEEGLTAQDAYQIFEEIRAKLRSEGNEKDEDLIMEVMDIVSGWCQPRYYVWETKIS